jgi:hypothetical protein
MHRICNEKIGPSNIDFAAKSYIALKKGRRAWLPMWPRQDGFYVYIASGRGGTEDLPSDFYAEVKEALDELKIEPSWTFKYNAGANPIAFNTSPTRRSSRSSRRHTDSLEPGRRTAFMTSQDIEATGGKRRRAALLITSRDDVDRYVSALRWANERTLAAIRAIECPQEAMRRLKFETVGSHPVKDRPLNAIEQINQTLNKNKY